MNVENMHAETIALSVGLNSHAKPAFVYLNQAPNLFLVYGSTTELQAYFTHFFAELAEQKICISYCLPHAMAKHCLQTQAETSILYGYQHPAQDDEIASAKAFWKLLFKSFKKRLKKAQQQSTNKQQFQPHVILIDDIVNILQVGNNYGIKFLEMAVFGHYVNMHMIVATTGTYRNLLHQLIKLNPRIEMHLNESNLLPLAPIINPIGTEMIMNTDGLLFIRERHQANFESLYPLPQINLAL